MITVIGKDSLFVQQVCSLLGRGGYSQWTPQTLLLVPSVSVYIIKQISSISVNIYLKLRKISKFNINYSWLEKIFDFKISRVFHPNHQTDVEVHTAVFEMSVYFFVKLIKIYLIQYYLSRKRDWLSGI